jgi:acetyltransferase
MRLDLTTVFAMSETTPLQALLAPRTIAVVGASSTPGKLGYELLRNLIDGGFEGTIVPVNPKAQEILGIPCRRDLKDFRGELDLAVIAVPTDQVADAIRGAIGAGVKSVVVITAGFKEVGAEGAAREEVIARLCADHRVRLMGPNCVGIVNTHHKMNATFAPSVPPAGGISVISQSGALCVAILDWAASEKMGCAKVISFGNKADLNEVDFLEALTVDDATRVIVGYLESITEGDEFLHAAEQAAAVKPVVVLKVGITAAGAQAARSHTGSLAGTDMAYGAAFRRSGVVRAEDFGALFDYALAFSTQPLPRGARLAILTNAGGPGIMAADAAESCGLVIKPPSAETRRRLAEFVPATAALGNPIDIIGDADTERYGRAFEVVQDDEATDGIVVLLTPQNMTRPVELAERLALAHRGEKPVLTAFLGGKEVLAARERLMALGIPHYPAPERAVAAFRAMADYAAWRRRPPRVVTRFPVNRRRVDRVIRWHQRMGIEQVGEVEAKEILHAYDFNILEGALAEDVEQAVETAERIGYPVVMKIVSPEIVHKSDFGGVRLNLSSPDAVRDAFDLMMLRVRRRQPEPRIRGVYVEKQAKKGREVILGMTRDPQFGPLLMFGLGGIFVEVMKDVTFYLVPITAEEAMQMLRATRSYELLKGARGHAPVDLESIAGGLQRISQLAKDYPQIAELDINPFIVGAVGTEAWVADARMTLKSPSS